MSYDTMIIDEDAARSDINKMNQAIELLTQARQSVVQLENSAESMQGHVGNAIAEKSQELEKRIDMLIRQLKNSISTVENTVREFQQYDSGFAGKIFK